MDAAAGASQPSQRSIFFYLARLSNYHQFSEYLNYLPPWIVILYYLAPRFSQLIQDQHEFKRIEISNDSSC